MISEVAEALDGYDSDVTESSVGFPLRRIFRHTARDVIFSRCLAVSKLGCTVTSDCGFPIANSITKVRSLFHRTMANHIRLLDNDHLTLSHVRKGRAEQRTVTAVCRGEAVTAKHYTRE